MGDPLLEAPVQVRQMYVETQEDLRRVRVQAAERISELETEQRRLLEQNNTLLRQNQILLGKLRRAREALDW